MYKRGPEAQAVRTLAQGGAGGELGGSVLGGREGSQCLCAHKPSSRKRAWPARSEDHILTLSYIASACLKVWLRN